MKKQKILLIDLETAPIHGYTWGKYEQTVIQFSKDWYMLSFSCKWLGKKKVYWYGLPSFRGYKKDKENDRLLSKKLWEFFNEADVIIAHNGNRFDIPKSNNRFIFHGFKPPSPYKKIDTLLMARKLGFTSNKLDDLAQTLGIGKKLPHEGKDTWFGCMTGDTKSWNTMRRYNKNDVFPLLEKVYLRLRMWDTTKAVLDPMGGCPKCGSKEFQHRGYWCIRNYKVEKLSCKNCGHWYQGKKEKV